MYIRYVIYCQRIIPQVTYYKNVKVCLQWINLVDTTFNQIIESNQKLDNNLTSYAPCCETWRIHHLRSIPGKMFNLNLITIRQIQVEEHAAKPLAWNHEKYYKRQKTLGNYSRLKRHDNYM